MTFGERRKRADLKLILKDMDEIESAFLADTKRLNKKRHTQLVKRVQKILPELREAHERGDNEQVNGLLLTLSMPSHKEYRKAITRLVKTSAHAGILRAHDELKRLAERYKFSIEDIYEGITLIAETTDEVNYPVQALAWLDNYALSVTVITEQTVISRIRAELLKALKGELSEAQTIQAIRETSATWLSPAHAETIARTESSKMYNAGRLARYTAKENKGFVVALQYDSIVDRRTTELCKHLDGRIISIENRSVIAEYSPPNHFKCRAVWLPVTRYEEWEDNFDTSMKPEKGFEDNQIEVSDVLNGGRKPLVKD